MTKTASWATYLGCSWTWCIGMFFPVLLLRDYGWTGFWVFAIPNVLGAAAMGTVLSSGDARRILDRHGCATRWFTWITVLYHAFFASFVLVTYDADLAFVAGVAIGVALMLRRSSQPLLSMLVWVVSLGVLAVSLFAERPPLREPTGNGAWMLLPVSIFGFLCCPYLDLTFLRARAETDERQGRIAFALGFGVCFFAMILLTTRYASTLLDPGLAPRWFLMLVLGHIGLQLGTTATMHLSELRDRSTAFVAVGALVTMLPFVLPIRIDGTEGLEYVYRTFLMAYGLVLPLYVWLEVIPQPRPDRVRLWPLIALTLAMLPLYRLAFIHGQEGWMLVAGAIVLVARPVRSRMA